MNKRTPRTYDSTHPFYGERGWIGDPARGEFLPREKKKPRRRRKRTLTAEKA